MPAKSKKTYGSISMKAVGTLSNLLMHSKLTMKEYEIHVDSIGISVFWSLSQAANSTTPSPNPPTDMCFGWTTSKISVVVV